VVCMVHNAGMLCQTTQTNRHWTTTVTLDYARSTNREHGKLHCHSTRFSYHEDVVAAVELARDLRPVPVLRRVHVLRRRQRMRGEAGRDLRPSCVLMGLGRQHSCVACI